MAMQTMFGFDVAYTVMLVPWMGHDGTASGSSVSALLPSLNIGLVVVIRGLAARAHLPAEEQNVTPIRNAAATISGGVSASRSCKHAGASSSRSVRPVLSYLALLLMPRPLARDLPRRPQPAAPVSPGAHRVTDRDMPGPAVAGRCGPG